MDLYSHENLNVDATDSKQSTLESKPTNIPAPSAEKRITFTLTTDSSPEGSQIISPKKFDAIAEEDDDKESVATTLSGKDTEEVILRPRLIDRHPHLLHGSSVAAKKQLRSAKSVPYFSVRSAASETDIFAITGSGQISMTPEVPSISFSNLPKNYEDTPTIEKYRVSQSLYSIQTENANRAGQHDYSMPRYFRRSAMLTQSNEVIPTSISPSSTPSTSKEEVRRPEKSKRLQMLRGALPPLLIHSVSFRKIRDEAKQLN